MRKIKRKNFIALLAFAGMFAAVVCAGVTADQKVIASENISEVTETVSNEQVLVDNNLDLEVANAGKEVETAPYSITDYETPVTMYASDTVNVRAGAGTEYDKIGKISWGSAVQVIGATDNGWYEISYNENLGFVMGDYLTEGVPSVPYLFVGDSRTVQLKMAVGSTDKAYVAKVGEGYNWFKNTALSEISETAGSGTVMVINFGVNDLGNASKYIKLVNSNIDAWTEAGITVYYAAVTPVGASARVTNEQIESFNTRLKNELDPRIQWIDGYTFLQQNGFNASDGLHYDKTTYKNLYSYYMSVMTTEA